MKKVISLKGELSTKDRMIFVVFGMAGLFTWSGLVIGPILATLSGLFPNKYLGGR